jgi:hypothetical protein
MVVPCFEIFRFSFFGVSFCIPTINLKKMWIAFRGVRRKFSCKCFCLLSGRAERIVDFTFLSAEFLMPFLCEFYQILPDHVHLPT